MSNGTLIGETAGTTIDHDDGAVASMIGQTGRAHVACAADAVDLANHPLVSQLRRSGHHRPDHFMTQDTVEVHIPVDDVQLGRADSSQVHSDQTFPFPHFGLGMIVDQGDVSVSNGDGSHNGSMQTRTYILRIKRLSP